MKKVLHILNSLQPSGAETMLNSSADCWKDYDKYILITLPERGSYAEQLEKSGYNLHQIADCNFFKKHYLTRKYMKKEKFDVIHIHRESESVFYTFDAKITGCKHIVRTVHNVFHFEGMLRYRRIFTRFCSRCMGEKMIAISSSVYENEKKWLKNKPYKIIKNWCDEEHFYSVTRIERQQARERLSIADNVFCIASVGNCSKAKNHIYILQALKELKEKSIFYLHIGTGVDEEKEKEFVRKNCLDKKVMFVGHAEPRIYLAAADLYVMPSHHEGVGISGLEAIYAGIPALFTYVAGLKDFENIDENAVIFSKYEQKDFTQKIKYLYDKFCKGEKIDCSNSMMRVRKIYNMEQSVSKYLEVYNE